MPATIEQPSTHTHTHTHTHIHTHTERERERDPRTHSAVRNLHRATSGMLCTRMKPTEYRVDSLPPSGSYTTPRAECFANV